MGKYGDTNASEQVGTDQSYQALDCVYVYARTWTELRTEPREKEGNARNLWLATRANDKILHYADGGGGGGKDRFPSVRAPDTAIHDKPSLCKERWALLRKESNEEIKQKKEERNHG